MPPTLTSDYWASVVVAAVASAAVTIAVVVTLWEGNTSLLDPPHRGAGAYVRALAALVLMAACAIDVAILSR